MGESPLLRAYDLFYLYPSFTIQDFFVSGYDMSVLKRKFNGNKLIEGVLVQGTFFLGINKVFCGKRLMRN